MLTVVIKDPSGLLLLCGRNDRSYKHVHYGYQQDNQQNELGLWRAKTVHFLHLTFAAVQENRMDSVVLTLASHSIPATEMPNSNTTVIHPMILMSFNGSTMIAECSWDQNEGKDE